MDGRFVANESETTKLLPVLWQSFQSRSWLTLALRLFCLEAPLKPDRSICVWTVSESAE